jgi:hypothetical protein
MIANLIAKAFCGTRDVTPFASFDFDSHQWDAAPGSYIERNSSALRHIKSSARIDINFGP